MFSSQRHPFDSGAHRATQYRFIAQPRRELDPRAADKITLFQHAAFTGRTLDARAGSRQIDFPSAVRKMMREMARSMSRNTTAFNLLTLAR